MSEKTIGQIAREAYGSKAPPWEEISKDWKAEWESAATAIWNKAVEECAKVCGSHAEHWPCGACSGAIEPTKCADELAEAIRDLKKGNPDERA